jgi:cell division protease FtsH
MPPTNPPPKDSKRPSSPLSGGVPPEWRSLLWSIAIILLVLWAWQDLFSNMQVRTIPYSEFKQYVAAHEVAECEIQQDEITGRIVPKPQPAAAPSAVPIVTESQPAASAAQKAAPTAAKKAEPQPSPQKNAPAPSNATAAEKPAPKQAAAQNSSSSETETSDKPFRFRTVRVEDDRQLIPQLMDAGVKFSAVRPSFFSTFLIAWILPLAFIVGIWWFLSRRIGGAGQAVMSIGKSKAKLVADTDTGVTFSDVAGCDEAKYELQEVVDFLKNPARYQALGAKIPKGILLIGPPGTGKTLLSRAVAGEAHVPFFSLTGSDFVEMFVGVGAARVRDLFEQAKKHAPCIIFIDEIDAIGRQRSVHMGPINDEREQTLNQLLAEMDGFQGNVGVLILGATNRPEVLDHALLRPGRFDRQVVVDAPDLDGREAILKVHARDKRLAEDVNLRKIAQATVGLSGADLANALNEAALLAVRRAAKAISQQDLEEAVEKEVAGPERKSRRLEPELKRRVAYHEVGHALVAAYSEHADPVHKISIIPRGRAALGYTLQLPIEEQYLMTRSELLERIRGLLGGRSAEEVVFGEISTGAENDLDHATALARQMVCLFGMSESLGLVHTSTRQNTYLPPMPGATNQLDCSDETARQVDVEVRKILDTAHQEAQSILREHRDQLDLVAHELLERETLDGETFRRLVGRSGPVEEKPPARPPGVPVAS